MQKPDEPSGLTYYPSELTTRVSFSNIFKKPDVANQTDVLSVDVLSELFTALSFRKVEVDCT